MSERMVSGVTITGYLNFIKKTKGKDGLNQCLRETNLDVIEVKNPLKYPYEYQVNVLKWIQKNQGDDAVVRAGRFAATDLGPLKLLAKLKSMEGMMEIAADRYHKTIYFGDIDLEKVADRHIMITLTDAANDKVNCMAWRGVFKGCGDLTGNKTTVIEKECVFRGDKACVFSVKW